MGKVFLSENFVYLLWDTVSIYKEKILIMSYLVNKAEVMEFFDNHIMKYIITDLEILNKIKADDSGIGGCAIPQALSTF
mgnify:FL=1